ncbi:MAG: DUF3375 domain-containing protein [Planctomycetia bacterium]|nr:DUF3375 domain-containing protein [Planctomycetia bacterium]
MRLSKLLVYFETSPALRLLRSPNAVFIVDFLDRQFKQAGRSALLHSDVLSALVAYQEELLESHPGHLSGKADGYLSEWCSRDSRWLQRFLKAGVNEPLYQLTPHTEDVFNFIDRVLDKDLGFVGTESRLKLVIDTLADLVVGSSDDPDVRLKHLRAERERIQTEIDQLESGGRVTRYQPTQIRERFATAVSLLRQLQGDFRAVEESFRDITVQVQQRHIGGLESRGRIVEFALDSEDLLKQEDQGVSFYEFVRLILSPSQTERLEKVIQEVRRIPELLHQQDGLDTIRGMVTLLQNEAEIVMQTNRRLSATLRRLVDPRAHAERQRIAQLLRDIRGGFMTLAPGAPIEEVGLSLDLDLAIESPFRRPFWTEPPKFDAVELAEFEPDSEDRLSAFRQLAAFHRLDWRTMRDRVRHMLTIEYAPTLGSLLKVHPADGGIIEVVGYVQIAAEDGHLIDAHARETVHVAPERPGARPILLTVPRVTFTPERRNGHAR